MAKPVETPVEISVYDSREIMGVYPELKSFFESARMLGDGLRVSDSLVSCAKFLAQDKKYAASIEVKKVIDSGIFETLGEFIIYVDDSKESNKYTLPVDLLASIVHSVTAFFAICETGFLAFHPKNAPSKPVEMKIDKAKMPVGKRVVN
jgi:hypothetical protein